MKKDGDHDPKAIYLELTAREVAVLILGVETLQERGFEMALVDLESFLKRLHGGLAMMTGVPIPRKKGEKG